MVKPFQHAVLAWLMLTGTLCCAFSSLAFSEADAGYIEIRHPVPPDQTMYTRGYRYFLELLALTLSKIEKPYVARPVMVPPAPDRRAMRFIIEDKYDVMWLHTNAMLEQNLRPVRIPVFKGLIGWRLLFVAAPHRDDFMNISVDALKTKTGLLGLNWPDVDIMKSNGFDIRTAADNGGNQLLIRLLKSERGDYFSRSVVEIWNEKKFFDDEQLVVEPNIALMYKTAFYLFVSKENETLARDLERGMEAAIVDGSFDELFYRYYGEDIRRSKLYERKIFVLENPSLPDETPVHRSELWLPENSPLARTLH